MTEAEAIEMLTIMRTFNNGSNAKVKAIDMAINALEKQIEKKPLGLYKNICPNCSWHIVGRNQQYCSDCGQKLDSEV